MPVRVVPTAVPDVCVVESPVFGDERGYFTELFVTEKFAEAGLPTTFVQDNLSKSSKGTMRGLHYQIDPNAQGKLVYALTGAIYDFGKWVAQELRGGSGMALWIPAGFAHGFIALEDNSLLFYKCTGPWARESERSLAYNDPQVGIEWPIAPTTISPKDAQAPTLDKAEYNFVFKN